MSNKLKDKKIAILVTDGFERSEFVEPRSVLESEGAEVHVISPKGGKVKSWDVSEWGDEFEVDKTLDAVNPDDYHSLVLPGGVLNPDNLRMDERAVQFVSSFLDRNKPVAAICHGPWTLIETGQLKDRKLTSYKSIKTDLINAGANWIDKEVVVDQNLITSRNPDDLPAFNKTIVEEFAAKDAVEA